LEQSRWGLRIRDLQLARNPDRNPPVAARFVVDTTVKVNGFGATGVGSAASFAGEDDGVP
jgi:hypothetical protein